MAYVQFKRGEKAKYYAVSKDTVRGHHIVTPYRSRPQADSRHVIVSGAKKQYILNRHGYAVTKKLPVVQKKRRVVRRSSGLSFGNFGGFRL